MMSSGLYKLVLWESWVFKTQVGKSGSCGILFHPTLLFKVRFFLLLGANYYFLIVYTCHLILSPCFLLVLSPPVSLSSHTLPELYVLSSSPSPSGIVQVFKCCTRNQGARPRAKMRSCKRKRGHYFCGNLTSMPHTSTWGQRLYLYIAFTLFLTL